MSLATRNYYSCDPFFPHGLIWPKTQIPQHPHCAASSRFALPEATGMRVACTQPPASGDKAGGTEI